MDGHFTLKLHLRAGKTSVEGKPKVEGDSLGSRNGTIGEPGREDAGKSCWISSFRGERGNSRGQKDAPDKQERGGSRRGRREVKELKEEERAGTRLAQAMQYA